MEEFFLKHRKVILVIGLLLILISPFLFTRLYFNDWFDFSNTGQIGDTIGGITAPIVNLLGAFIVYISFMAQVKANEIQQTALEDEKKRNRLNNNFSTLLPLLKEYQEDFEKLGGKDILMKFRGSFESFVKTEIKQSNNPNILIKLPQTVFSNITIFTDYYMMFKFLLMVLNRLKSIELNYEDKELLISISQTFYEIQLKEDIDKIIEQYSLLRKKQIEIPENKYNFFSTIQDIQSHFKI